MNSHKPYGIYEKYLKRPIDIICGVLAVVALSWLYLLLIVLGAFFMRGNPFFTQERPGKNGAIFKLIKFRSMDSRRDENGNLLPDNIRLNKYGRLLRTTSLDELPEIFNIIKGDMSIIGPRPLAVEYLDYYTREERKRHDVRPGLSGLAQVNGRNSISWEQKFKYDVEYVEKISFLRDFQILLLTVKKVFVHEGIGQGEEAPQSLHFERKDWCITPDGAIKPSVGNKVMR